MNSVILRNATGSATNTKGEIIMLNKAVAREMLSRKTGTWVSHKDRQVTNWGNGKLELEDWSNKNYYYAETDSIDIALRFLEKGCELYA